jgi:hypothetical protein
MSVFDIIEQPKLYERTESEREFLEWTALNMAPSRLLIKCSMVYSQLLVKHSSASKRMSEFDRQSFHRRLYAMAKRQVIPYGGEFFSQDNQRKELALGVARKSNLFKHVVPT